MNKKEFFAVKAARLTLYKPKETMHRPSSRHIPSLDTGLAVALAKDIPEYTGENMIGVSQLHKSNAVPVFREEDILDIGKMRRWQSRLNNV